MSIGTWNEIVFAFEFCYLQSKIVISKFPIHEVPFPSLTNSIPGVFPGLLLVRGSTALLQVLWSPSALLFSQADEVLQSALKHGRQHGYAHVHERAAHVPCTAPSPSAPFPVRALSLLLFAAPPPAPLPRQEKPESKAAS